MGKNKFVLTALCLVFLFSAASAFSQDRSFIRNQIDEWGQCRTVAITRTNGNAAIYGANGWAAASIPRGLENALARLNSDDEYIKDVVLTESGRWLILHGSNGVTWDGIPDNDPMLAKLREYNSQGEIITSVAFNDSGEWVVITNNFYASSNNAIQEWLTEGNRQYGLIWTVHISDEGMLAVFEDGYRTSGVVPSDLIDALNRTNLEYYYVKFAGPAWFFGTLRGGFQYNM